MEAWPQMAENPVWAICERAAEVQTLLDDHIAGGKHTTADVIAKAQASPPITGSGRAYRSRPSQSWQPKHF